MKNILKSRTFLIVCSWIVITTSTLLNAVLRGPFLQWYDYLILILASLLAGALIIDLKKVVVYTLITLAATYALSLFCLSALPILTGKIIWASETINLTLEAGIIMVVRATFPTLWIIYFLVALIGGFIGESLFNDVL